MQIITLHLPEPVIQAVDRMVRMKLYPYRNTALRFIIQRGLREHMRILLMLDGQKPSHEFNANNPAKEFSFDDYGEKAAFVSLKIPKGLLALMKMDMETKGIRNRSEYIRQAILNFIMDGMKEE
jgi:metal-responsive CopG/Arc/MetJ family transcriptional regulator